MGQTSETPANLFALALTDWRQPDPKWHGDLPPSEKQALSERPDLQRKKVLDLRVAGAWYLPASFT